MAWGVGGPVGGGFRDGLDVDEVEDHLHGKHGEEDAGAVEDDAGFGERYGGVSLLRDVVVEGEDRAD